MRNGEIMIPLMKNTFLHEPDTKKALAEFILRAERLSLGSECFTFEKQFAAYQQTNEAILFNSGGSANLALIQSLKNLALLEDGSKIGFSALTWSTNVMPIIQMNMIPVPLDINIKTLNVSSGTLLERLKSEKLDAVFLTNALGFTGDLPHIQKICKKHDVILIEDNCESLGTELQEGKAGNFGLAATFSFFVAHHMSTIEGGMVTTNNRELAEMLRIVRANGWDRNLDTTQQTTIRTKFGIESEFDAKYTFYDLGYNLRPTEITGFLGQYQIQYLEECIDIREKNYLTIEQEVKENPDLITPEHDHITRLSNFAFPVICQTPDLRKKYVARFSSSDIEVRPMIAGNIQRQPFYTKYIQKMFDLPGTEFIHACGFYCGNYPELSGDELKSIRTCLKNKEEFQKNTCI
jgi:CDP-6-deoxy-D-xylo-4-hexulose-3-dehydrase